MATGTDRVKAKDGDGWQVVAAGETLVGGRNVEGTGELFFGATASPPGKDSKGVPIYQGETFDFECGAANSVWVRTAGIIELAVVRST